MGVGTVVPEQLGALGQVVSPPPVTVAVLVPLVAEAATLMGTLIEIVPVATPAAIVQPAKVLPLVGQADNVAVPLLTVGAPAREMPVGKVSDSAMVAVVGPFATVILMV